MTHPLGDIRGRHLCAALALGWGLVSAGACATATGGDAATGETRREAVSVIAVFDDYNEVLRGDGFTDLDLRLHFLDFRGLVSGTRCVGHGRVTHVPADSDFETHCAGIRGSSTVTCVDGRVVNLEFRADPDCRGGWGVGQDQFGHALSFVYGLPETEAEKVVRDALRRSSQNPALPVYRPEEVRREQGFSTGTAFFVADDGYLMTSEHVVHGATSIWVIDDSGVEHPVQYVTGDEENDLALLRVEDLRATPLPIRSADELSKGEEVFALGYPMVQLQGQEQKATFGRVNALSGAAGDTRFLQVDVPIQPGNSGGPLFDMQGRVVGVMTATLDQVVAFRAAGVVPQNVNYAIRSDFVQRLMQSGPSGAARTAPSGSPLEPRELIPHVEGSVILLIAR